MRKPEKILAIISFAAIILNLLNFPFATALLTIVVSSLAMYNLVFGFSILHDIPPKLIFKAETYTGISNQNRYYTRITGQAFAIVIIGILFRLQAWPFDKICLSVGLILLTIISIVALYKYMKTSAVFYRRVLLRSAIYASLGLMFLLLPKYLWLEIKHRDNPAYIEEVKQKRNKIEQNEVNDYFE